MAITDARQRLTLISEAGLSVGADPPERPDDLNVQGMLVLVLRVLQEGCQLHLHPLQKLKLQAHAGINFSRAHYPSGVHTLVHNHWSALVFMQFDMQLNLQIKGLDD